MKKVIFILTAIVALALTSTAQTYTVNTSKSVLKWTGKKVTGEHFGKISLKEGSFSLENDKISTGNFVIDMNSISCDDLEGEWSDKLIGHLKSDDFFGTEAHPEAVLVIKESTKLKNNMATVKGDLTIKGITQPIEFEATQLGDTFSALLTVDRSQYNIRYGSGKFFDNLGDKTIYDDFTIEVKLEANSKLSSK